MSPMPSPEDFINTIRENSFAKKEARASLAVPINRQIRFWFRDGNDVEPYREAWMMMFPMLLDQEAPKTFPPAHWTISEKESN